MKRSRLDPKRYIFDRRTRRQVLLAKVSLYFLKKYVFPFFKFTLRLLFMINTFKQIVPLSAQVLVGGPTHGLIGENLLGLLLSFLFTLRNEMFVL